MLSGGPFGGRLVAVGLRFTSYRVSSVRFWSLLGLLLFLGESFGFLLGPREASLGPLVLPLGLLLGILGCVLFGVFRVSPRCAHDRGIIRTKKRPYLN